MNVIPCSICGAKPEVRFEFAGGLLLSWQRVEHHTTCDYAKGQVAISFDAR